MQNVLKEAEENLSDLKIVTLEIFSGNNIAYDLYRSFGFKEYGLLPVGILYKDEYLDRILLYNEIK